MSHMLRFVVAATIYALAAAPSNKTEFQIPDGQFDVVFTGAISSMAIIPPSGSPFPR